MKSVNVQAFWGKVDRATFKPNLSMLNLILMAVTMRLVSKRF